MAERRTIDGEPEISEDLSLAIRSTAHGTATNAQQLATMRFILVDLCGITAVEQADMTDREGAFLAGKRWVGMMLARKSKMTLWINEQIEDEAEQ